MSVITLQFGQCGNQIGQKLYECLYDDININNKVPACAIENYVAESTNKWFHVTKKEEWQPRSILIDTETKVTSFANLQKHYHFNSIISEASGGSANNWAYGYNCKSELLIGAIMESLRKELEQCDYLTSFLNIFSAAGGTGSGVGSKIVKKLHDHYPSKTIINSLVLPYQTGEVVTQNYNAVLTLVKLYKYSDATFIFENDKIHKLCPLHTSTSEVSYNDINSIIVQQLIGLSQPVQNYSFETYISDLTAHPSYKFLQLKSAPHLQKENVKYETSSSWSTLLKLIFKSIAMDEILLKRMKLRCKSVGNVIVSRGNDVMKTVDVKTQFESKMFPMWLPHEARFQHYHQIRQLKDTEKFLTVCSNSNNICSTLNSLLEEAWNLFTSGAYVHHYKKYGIDETYFLKSFEKLENVLHEYSSL